MAVGIIDYGVGNIQSVMNAFEFIGIEAFVSSNPLELEMADRIILPGVGAFKDAMDLLKVHKMDKFLEKCKAEGKPILGICLGMQLLFESSTEFGYHEGLGLIKGKIVKMDVEDLKVPHMGWNRLEVTKEEPLLKKLGDHPYVYFVHSYHLSTTEDVVSATTYYGKSIQVAAQDGQVYGLQFHPEKSGDIGLQILRNFSEI